MKAVMLLHGFSTDIRDFDKLIPKIKMIYDAIEFVSFPGHGKDANIKDFEEKKTFDIMLESYDKLKETFDCIDVIGFSMGGALATYLQTVREVNKLVLLAPANKYINLKILPIQFLFLTKLYTRSMFGSYLKSEDLYIHKETMKNYKENFKKSLELTTKELMPRYNPTSINTFTRIIKRCNKNLNEIKPPTLIIWGQLDELVPKSAIKYDYNLCTNKNKKLIIYDDLSHLMLHSYDVDHIINEIINFLK